MATKTFTKDFMIAVLDGAQGSIISDNVVDNSRWSIQHELIFNFEGKFYQADYQVGATEQQYETPWQYDKEVTATEVQPVEKLVTVYEPVKDETPAAQPQDVAA